MRDVPQFVLERAAATEPVFTADEVAMWPDGLLDQLVADGVLKATGNATSVTCDACGHDHVETIDFIESPPGSELRVYISCPDSGRVRIPLDRLRRWRVIDVKVSVPKLSGSPVPRMLVESAGGNHVGLPHALAVAHATLDAALNEAIDVYKRNLRFPNPSPVIDAIERFVYEVELTPKWHNEMLRRVTLVESTCRQGSPYACARQLALNSHTAAPPQLCRGTLGIERLRNSSADCPCFLAEVIEVRKSIDAVLEEPPLGLSSAAGQAFGDWRDTCRTIQNQAERLDVDGCWYLHHVYEAAKSDPSDRSEAAKAILRTNMGGANLDSIRAAALSIVAWVRECSALETDQEETAGRKSRGRKHAERGVPKRSWTQQDLNEAIREYKSERASTYNDLVDGVKRGKTGAKKSARDLFGRNAIVRALGVKSAAMVSNSPVWQTIADELKLRGPSRVTSRRPAQRIGLDIAIEDQAQAASTPILDQAVQQETVRLIEKSMPATEAEATIEKLQRGEITDDAARELVDVFAQQQFDKRTHKVRQAP